MKKHLFNRLYIAICILGIVFLGSGYLKSNQVQAAQGEVGVVSSATLNIRRSPSTGSKLVVQLKKGSRVNCLNLKTTWVKVSIGNYVGYTQGKYIKTAYGTASDPYASISNGKVNSASLNIRETASHQSKVLKVITKNTTVQVLTSGTEWIKLKVGDTIGYTQGKYITLSSGKPAYIDPNESASSVKAQQLISYAKQFLGNRYVWGGTSLTKGTDCSGFTMRVFQHFGYNLPRTSAQQRSAGTRVSSLKDARPGDLICYYGHVAIYMGNNTIIHASNRKDGIKISYNAAYRKIASIRRIIK